MAALIKWEAVGQIFVESFAAAVLVVGLVAIGARLLALSEPAGHQDPASPTGAARAASVAAAVVCFLIALAAIGYGVYFTIDK